MTDKPDKTLDLYLRLYKMSKLILVCGLLALAVREHTQPVSIVNNTKKDGKTG